MTDTDLWATAREWAERSGTVTSTLARLALDTKAERDEARAEVADLRDRLASVKALLTDDQPYLVPFIDGDDLEGVLVEDLRAALRAEVADLRDRLASVKALLTDDQPYLVPFIDGDDLEGVLVEDLRAALRAEVADLRDRLASVEALREFADECDGPDSSLHVMGAAQAARERADRIEGEHHPDCYQVVGVPDDLPDDLCDCRVLRLIEGATDER